MTAKPTIYAANVAEDDLADDGASNPHVAKVREMAKEEGAEVFVICAQIEQELADLDDDEKKEYLEDLGVSSSGLDKLVAASYSLLGLISFLTAGEDECRAWTIKKGTKAPQAAGKDPIQTLNVVSSKPKLSTIRIFLITEVSLLPRKKALLVWKARNMLSKTAT